MAEADPAIPEPSAKEAISFEANQVLKEIGFAVERVEISKELPSNESVTYLNLVTREKETYCVELSTKGYRVVGKAFDISEIPPEASQYFETVYSLLNRISPMYRDSFGTTLASKLAQIQSEREHQQS
ncbi:GSK3B-interacting protein-like [Oscarella lobularis]|uniref:GSK3B-interacting protein-like n=1 Tax=Oscarella lobularis TaxID=121494 RepID=UPI0033134BF8